MQLYLYPLLAFALASAVSSAAQTTSAGGPRSAPPSEKLSVLGPVESALERLGELRVLQLADAEGARVTNSLIPDEVARRLPAAAYREDGLDVIDYPSLVATLVASVQELERATATLNAQVDHLLRDKADLERSVDALDAQSEELDRGLRAVQAVRGAVRGTPGTATVAAGNY